MLMPFFLALLIRDHIIQTFLSPLTLLLLINSSPTDVLCMLGLCSPTDINDHVHLAAIHGCCAHAILSCTPDQRPHYSDISQLSNTATSDQQ